MNNFFVSEEEKMEDVEDALRNIKCTKLEEVENFLREYERYKNETNEEEMWN